MKIFLQWKHVFMNSLSLSEFHVSYLVFFEFMNTWIRNIRSCWLIWVRNEFELWQGMPVGWTYAIHCTVYNLYMYMYFITCACVDFKRHTLPSNVPNSSDNSRAGLQRPMAGFDGWKKGRRNRVKHKSFTLAGWWGKFFMRTNRCYCVL